MSVYFVYNFLIHTPLSLYDDDDDHHHQQQQQQQVYDKIFHVVVFLYTLL